MSVFCFSISRQKRYSVVGVWCGVLESDETVTAAAEVVVHEWTASGRPVTIAIRTSVTMETRKTTEESYT